MSFATDLFYLVANDWLPLVRGLGVSLSLLFVSVLFGVLLAVPVSLALVSRTAWISAPAKIFTMAFRGSPLFTQVFLFYFGAPALISSAYGNDVAALRASMWWPLISSPFLIVAIAFTINMTAYAAEHLRGGLLAVPAGDREAAVACGMGYWLMQRRIVLPGAFRRALPALFNEVIFTLKATALGSTVTLHDLMGVGNAIYSRTYDLKIYLVIAAVYLVLVFLLARILSLVERRLTPQSNRLLEIGPRSAGRYPQSA